MQGSAVHLDLSSDGVAELLSDFDLLSMFEAIRRHRRAVGLAAVAEDAGVTTRVAQLGLDRLAALGLVTAARTGRTRSMTYLPARGPLLVSFDPADPKSAFRLASARMALLSHLRRLGSAKPARASRKGAGWRRDSMAVIPLEGESLELVRSCVDRFDACLEAASERCSAEGPAAGTPDSRPKYRIQVTVDPIEVRAKSLPVILLMQRSEAALRAARVPPPSSLSRRERQVADALAKGMTKREAAASIGLAYATVNTLAVRAYRKLGVSRRAQLADALRGIA